MQPKADNKKHIPVVVSLYDEDRLKDITHNNEMSQISSR